MLPSVAGSQNLPQVDLILYLPNTYPDILENEEKKSPFSNIFGYKWTRLKLGKDKYAIFSIFYMSFNLGSKGWLMQLLRDLYPRV